MRISRKKFRTFFAIFVSRPSTRAFGRWCLGAHLSRMAKREVRKFFFTFVLLSRWRSTRTKKIAPIILHSKTILRN